MLFSQNGGRHEYGDLFAVHNRLECGPNSDLRLPETHIPAYEPVHGVRVLHVALYLFDGSQLVGCLLVPKSRFELVLPLGIGRETMPPETRTRRIELQQFGCHGLNRFLHMALYLLPGGRSYPVYSGPSPLLAYILLKEIDLVDRNKNLVAVPVLNLYEVLFRPARGQFFDPPVYPDAMLHVYDIIALRDRAQGVHGLRTGFERRRPIPLFSVEYLPVKYHGELHVFIRKTFRKVQGMDVQVFITLKQIRKKLPQPFGLALITRSDHYGIALVEHASHILLELLDPSAVSHSLLR